MLDKKERRFFFTDRQFQQLILTNDRLRQSNGSALRELRRVGRSNLTSKKYKQAGIRLQMVAAQIIGVLQLREDILISAREQGAVLNAAIQEHYQPVGWLEERWLETIAVWSWRLRRVIRYETGQIARTLAEHSEDLQRSREADPEPGSVASSNPEMDAMTDHLFLTSEGLENQMRYEAMINRMLNHAIAELERIQTRRKEAAPVADR